MPVFCFSKNLDRPAKYELEREFGSANVWFDSQISGKVNISMEFINLKFMDWECRFSYHIANTKPLDYKFLSINYKPSTNAFAVDVYDDVLKMERTLELWVEKLSSVNNYWKTTSTYDISLINERRNLEIRLEKFNIAMVDQ